MAEISAPLAGIVVWTAEVGATLADGAAVAMIESMKMEHPVVVSGSSEVASVHVAVGDQVSVGDRIAAVSAAAAGETVVDVDGGPAHAAAAEALERHRIGLDEARPEAVEKRHARGHRTARENIADLVDPGSFIEYGALTIAAQRRRREVNDLIERTPADGLVGGVATINAERFGEANTRCVVSSYDYTVLAGTQGMMNHLKKDRLFELAGSEGLPVILYTEGGGGRPGDVDHPGASWLDCRAFALLGRLTGQVPLIGVNSGYCFAGNAALLGTCDVVIATEDSNIGMAGPAMIAGGGLGDVAPTDIGPASVHAATGTVDLVVADEAAATAAAKRLVGFTQGSNNSWSPPDGMTLDDVVPGDRKRVYDMRDVLPGLLDADSSLELREHAHPGLLTVLGRIEGHAVGVVANNPLHLSGAIDHQAAVKMAWFMELCDSWQIPLLFLCDTPGFMVGPESDAEGLPRSAGKLFRLGGTISVPFGTVVTRKGYGLGAQSMAGGGFREGLFTVSWPTGEFGPMGLEGAVELGFSKELAAVEGAEREQLFEELVDRMYEVGKAVNVASHFEIDDVIPPSDTRRWAGLLFGR